MNKQISKEKHREYYQRWYQNNLEKARKMKRENMRKYRTEQKDRYNEYSRNRIKIEREALFEMYGHECSICGFKDKRALTLDHVKRNGGEERRKYSGRGVYRKALKEYRPDLYRTLCMNCQFIERLPHLKYLQGI